MCILVQLADCWPPLDLIHALRLPFGEFDQEGFGQSKRWTGSDLTHVAIYSNLFGPYTIAVDDIRFY
ncbi:MAG: hypothetical protein OXT73_03295 [Bacteroidota bacterium]|nr:hypothetical protein [Bacteroidota bacterium]